LIGGRVTNLLRSIDILSAVVYEASHTSQSVSQRRARYGVVRALCSGWQATVSIQSNRSSETR